jgi:ParB-like chromosome segregation protein Spo0J
LLGEEDEGDGEVARAGGLRLLDLPAELEPVAKRVSATIRSGRAAATAARPSVAVATAWTSKPALRRLTSRSLWIGASPSTTRIRRRPVC